MDINNLCCEDMNMLVKNHELFSQDEGYGWVLYWNEIDKEGKKHSRITNYGIKISFCPFCGKNLEKIT